MVGDRAAAARVVAFQDLVHLETLEVRSLGNSRQIKRDIRATTPLLEDRAAFLLERSASLLEQSAALMRQAREFAAQAHAERAAELSRLAEKDQAEV